MPIDCCTLLEYPFKARACQCVSLGASARVPVSVVPCPTPCRIVQLQADQRY